MTFEQTKHPRDDGGKFTEVSVKGVNVGKKKKPSRNPKMTIVEAADRLEKKGHKLLGTAEYDLKNLTARYRIKTPDGKTVIMTSDEIDDIIG